MAVPNELAGRSFTRVGDLDTGDWLSVLDLADSLKRSRANGEPTPLLAGRTLGLIFHKPSTRTRVSFEVGIYELGGIALHLSAAELQLAAARRSETRQPCSRATSTES